MRLGKVTSDLFTRCWFYSDCIIESLFVAVSLQVEMHDDCLIDLSLNIQSCEWHQRFKYNLYLYLQNDNKQFLPSDLLGINLESLNSTGHNLQ